MHGLEREFGEEIDFRRFNVADPDLEKIQLGYDLRGHPTAAVLDEEGAVVARFFGVRPAEEIRPALLKALGRGD